MVLMICMSSVFSQILKPVKWSYASKRLSSTVAIVYFKATIDKSWHIYSQNLKEGGPVKTSFKFKTSKDFTLSGKTLEPKPITRFEKSFGMNVSFFENSVIFSQKINVKMLKTYVSGTLEFMVCNDKQCLPPDEIAFSIPVKAMSK